MWQAVTARATGTSHVASGTLCQDRETFRLVDNADGGEVAIGVVCDGAGSARFAEIGAEIVSTALRTIAGAYVSEYGSSQISPFEVREWILEIRQRVCNQADAQEANSRDYACTLVFVIASDTHTICGQVGDGAIILKDGDELRVALWPDNGEYANQTFFVTQEECHERLQLTKVGPVTDFVLFSDGLQTLALNHASKSAHSAFFEPLIRTVRASDKLDATKSDLEAFLESDRINKRTDDDKSIVVACRIA